MATPYSSSAMAVPAAPWRMRHAATACFLWKSQGAGIYDMGVSRTGGTPKIGWFMMENPIDMDDDWGYPYDETETWLYDDDICVLLF